jgi:multidrug efflux pump subunit AcrB
MLAIPMGFVGAHYLAVDSYYFERDVADGRLMLIGIADSNSILIVDFATNWKIRACRSRMP